ncbi:MAG: response regulator [Planctomycetes bacterium]|nr:response regulator [Planctomycetota bacterium]
MLNSKLGRGTICSISIATGPLDGVEMFDEVKAYGAVAAVLQQGKNRNETLSGRVLLAEDGPDNQRLIAFILRKAGLEVSIADHGEMACDLATNATSDGRPFDLILMDMQMPVMDGYAATRQLRQLGYQVPIIALTAFAMTGDSEKCLDAGCDAYATKPIRREELIELIASHLNAADDRCVIVSSVGQRTE